VLRSAAVVVVVGLLLFCLTGAVAAADAPARPVQVDALAASGPPLHTPAAALAASLSCAGDVSGSPLTPVLLVHGTGSTPQGSWGPIYLPLFAAEGRPACTVALPARATGDEQVAVEYVVSAIRSMSAARHGRIDVVGHSQGAFLPVLALEFWPDLAGDVEDYVGLAPTLTVGTTGEVMCAMACTAPFQQRRASSAFFSGFLAHPLPAGPSYTTIATLTDEVATPEPATSHLDGAENVVLQQVCPAKVVDHFALLSDGTVHDLVLDALTHAGPTGPTRLPVTACADALPAGVDPATVAPLLAEAVADDLVTNGQAQKLTAEPPVRCYLAAGCTDVDDRGRLLGAARVEGSRLDLAGQAPGTVATLLRGLAGATRTLTATAVTVGALGVALPRDLPAGRWAAELRTTTGYYTAPGLEAVLPFTVAGAAAGQPAHLGATHREAAAAAGTADRPAGSAPLGPSRSLAATGGLPHAALAGAAAAVALLATRLRRRPRRGEDAVLQPIARVDQRDTPTAARLDRLHPMQDCSPVRGLPPGVSLRGVSHASYRPCPATRRRPRSHRPARSRARPGRGGGHDRQLLALLLRQRHHGRRQWRSRAGLPRHHRLHRRLLGRHQPGLQPRRAELPERS